MSDIKDIKSITFTTQWSSNHGSRKEAEEDTLKKLNEWKRKENPKILSISERTMLIDEWEKGGEAKTYILKIFYE